MQSKRVFTEKQKKGVFFNRWVYRHFLRSNDKPEAYVSPACLRLVSVFCFALPLA